MKKYCIISIILFHSIIGINFLYAQNCFRLTIEHNPELLRFNPDSVMYDTCLSQGQVNYNFSYAKKYFMLDLPYQALFVPELPWDTLVYRQWQDIDTSFISLRNKLDTLELFYGNYLL